jgi:hypothetical protein
VRHGSTPGELLLGGLDVVQQLEALDQRVVLPDVDEHRCTPPVLGEDNGPAGPLHAAHDRCDMRAEVGQGLDVLSEPRMSHHDLNVSAARKG